MSVKNQHFIPQVYDIKTAGHSSHKATVSGYFCTDNDTLL